MTVPTVSSPVEKSPDTFSQTLKSEDSSEIYTHRTAPTSSAKHEGHVLIGEGVEIKGEIRECREIEIHGTVEGDLEAEVLIVHQNGLVKGNVNTDRAEIHGSIDGDVIVKNRLDVKAKGSVAGKTEYGELSVEAGGRVVGTLEEKDTRTDQPAVETLQKPATDPMRTVRSPTVSNPTDRAPALTDNQNKISASA